MVGIKRHELPFIFILLFFVDKAKQLIQIAILGAQVIGRAFSRALRQELQCRKKHFFQTKKNMFILNLDAKTATESGKTSSKTVQADRVSGMTLQVNNIFLFNLSMENYY
jgi:hypothetical protein